MTDVVLGGMRAWLSWTAAVSFVLLVFALQTGYAITNVYVAQDLKLSLVQVGIVGSVYTWVFAIAQFSSGSILDRIGCQRVLPIAASLVSLGAFLFANAPTLPFLLVAQILLAVGASCGFIGAGFVGGQWFSPTRYGFMFALVQLVASLSAVAGQQIINVAIQDVSWTAIINFLGFSGVVIVIFMLLLLRDPDNGKSRASWKGFSPFMSELVNDLSHVASNRDAWVNALIGGATFGTMLALGVVWGPRLLVAGGLDTAAANAASSYSWFGLAIGSPVYAWISDKFKSRRKPMAWGCGLQLGTLLVILSQANSNAVFASVLFFIFGFMAGGSMIAFTISMELVNKQLVGTSAALVNATQFILGGIFMAIPGSVLAGTGLIARIGGIEGISEGRFGDYQWALSVYALALAAAMVLFVFLKETWPNKQAVSPGP